LWALVEISLGGFLHALRLPFTGITVGSIAILTLFLIARNSETYKEVFQAFITVAGLKLVLSPQSSPFSYVAMFIQTLCVLPLTGVNRNPGRARITSLILLASLYSPLQKILILWFTLGSELLYGISDWVQGIIPIQNIQSLVWWLPIATWIFIHLIAGFIISTFAIRWKFGLNRDQYLSEQWDLFNKLERPGSTNSNFSRLSNQMMPIIFLLVGPILILSFAAHESWIKLIIRPLVILSIWFILLRPMLYFLGSKRILNLRDSILHQQLQTMIPIFRRGVLFSWKEAKQVSWFRFPGRFITVFFTWGLFLTWES